MLSELLKNKSLFYRLCDIDKITAEQYRRMPCPHCGGPLYYANYFRKPRGEPDVLPESCFIRYSLCCGAKGCRHRVLPPSCRFLGRKIYWYPVILSIISDWQNKSIEFCISRLALKLDISRNTIQRWIVFFQKSFPLSIEWRSVRGYVPAFIRNNRLPANIVNYYLSLKECCQDALVACIKLLSGIVQKIGGR